MNDNNVNNDNVNLTPNSYTKDTDTRILDAKYAAMKKMAEAPTLSESYTINPDGSRTYSDKAAGARREFYVNTATPLKSDAVKRYEDFLIRNTRKTDNTGYLENNVVVASKPKSVRDLDQPFSVRLAAATNSPINQKQNQAPSSSMSDDPASLNYNEDYATAQMIINDLKKNDLASGQEFSSSDLESLIRKKYPNINDNIVHTVIDLLTNDVQDISARVAGSNYQEMRVLISAKNAAFGKPPQPATLNNQTTNQSPQQQQPQQPQQNNNSSKIPPEIQQKIDALSDQDKQLLQQTAVSVVNDMLHQIQQPIDELQLESQIASKYNVSSALADLLVEVLKVYPEYAKLIKPQQQPNQPSQQNQQQQQNQQPPNNDGVYSQGAKSKPTSTAAQRPSMMNNTDNTTTTATDTSTTTKADQQSNNLGKTGFFNYKSMGHCLDHQSQTLSQADAVDTCSKLFKQHMKNQTQPNQQQQQSGQQQLQQKAAAVNYRDMSWRELRDIIVRNPIS